jgi:hypothetical protein
MESSRSYSGHFKSYAYVWRRSFGQRQPNYDAEERRYIDTLAPEDFALTGPEWVATQQRLRAQGRLVAQRRLPTQEFIERFINNGCSNDIGRYLHRNTQLCTFLEDAEIDTLSTPTALVLKPMALMDDRNNDSVTRERLTGSCRAFKGPLNAHQLYLELSEEVRTKITLSQAFLFAIPSSNEISRTSTRRACSSYKHSSVEIRLY